MKLNQLTFTRVEAFSNVYYDSDIDELVAELYATFDLVAAKFDGERAVIEVGSFLPDEYEGVCEQSIGTVCVTGPRRQTSLLAAIIENENDRGNPCYDYIEARAREEAEYDSYRAILAA